MVIKLAQNLFLFVVVTIVFMLCAGEAMAFLSTQTAQEIIRSSQKFLFLVLLSILLIYSAVLFPLLHLKKKKAKQKLKKISETDNIWNQSRIKSWVSDLFEEVFYAYQKQNHKPLLNISTENFQRAFDLKFKQYKKGFMSHHIEAFVFTDCEIVVVKDYIDNEQDTMVVVVSAELIEYLIFIPEDSVVEGEKDFRKYRGLWYFKRKQNKWLLDKIEHSPSLTGLKNLDSFVE